MKSQARARTPSFFFQEGLSATLPRFLFDTIPEQTSKVKALGWMHRKGLHQGHLLQCAMCWCGEAKIVFFACAKDSESSQKREEIR
jgi:hypothetical protein